MIDTFEFKFKNYIKHNKSHIEQSICDNISNYSSLCPASEGVPCTECIKFALSIMLDSEVNKRYGY